MRVILSGWEVGMKKIGLVQYLRANGQMSLSDAKSAVDAILAGHKVALVLTGEGSLHLHLERLRALGAVVRADDAH